MAELAAKIPLVLDAARYEIGDKLPADYEQQADFWIDSGIAMWLDREVAQATAKPATATPGLPGIAVGGEGAYENLVGRIPQTPRRERTP